MPLYAFNCYRGHEQEHFVRTWDEANDSKFQCHLCHAPMFRTEACLGSGLLWAEEGRPRTIYNLGPDPVVITSRKEHKEAMKKAGVVEAGNRRGEKGVWV